jgi:ubiquinone biosynthesis protein
MELRWQRLHATNARRIARQFTELRGVFIKMGQVLSVMAPVLPPVYAQELEKLQDAVPPQPYEWMRHRLVQAWGDDPEAKFAEVDRTALAAASLAQVHRARLVDGTEVVLKILYPGIEDLVRSDLARVRRLLPGFRILFGFRDSAKVHDQLTLMLEHEMDYHRERENTELIRGLLASHPKIVVPRVVESLSSHKVLVLTYEHGCKVHDPEVLRAAGIDPEAIASTLVAAYASMLFEHRVFHADPHPGNLLARPDGSLVLLDFGAVEHASVEITDGMKQVLLGAMLKDTDKVMAGVERMGFLAPDGNHELLRQVTAEYLGVLGALNVQNYMSLSRDQLERASGMQQLRGKLRKVTGSIRYPDGYFYVERTLTLLFGVTARLAPTKGLFGLAAPYTAKLMLRAMANNPAPAPTLGTASA